ADPVWAKLERLRELPAGVIHDPRRMTFSSPWYLDASRRAGELLAARGLQMQKKGKPEGFVPNLETALALIRNLGDAGWGMGVGIERDQTTALMSWLEALGNDAPLFRRALKALQKHRGLVPTTLPDPRFFSYLVAKNSLARPAEFLGSSLPSGHQAAVEPAV